MHVFCVFSKKDGKVRSQELADYVSSQLLQYIVDHSRDLVMNNNTLLFILAVISHARGITGLHS